MLFAYGKSPLGPVVRFCRVAAVAYCESREDAERVARTLREKLSGAVEIIDVSSIDGVYKLGLVDSDSMDKALGIRYAVLAEWI